MGEIIKRFEARGFKVAGLKMVKSTSDHIKKHYLATPEQLGGMGNKSLENLKQLALILFLLIRLNLFLLSLVGRWPCL